MYIYTDASIVLVSVVDQFSHEYLINVKLMGHFPTNALKLINVWKNCKIAVKGRCITIALLSTDSHLHKHVSEEGNLRTYCFILSVTSTGL